MQGQQNIKFPNLFNFKMLKLCSHICIPRTHPLNLENTISSYYQIAQFHTVRKSVQKKFSLFGNLFLTPSEPVCVPNSHPHVHAGHLYG